MKPHFNLILSLCIVFTLMAGSTATLAQTTGPDHPRPWRRPGRSAPAVPAGDPRHTLPEGQRAHDRPASQAEAPKDVSYAVGAPGVTYSHSATFGEADKAYFGDPQHLVYPYGVATDGAYIWIADANGRRALKFDAGGNHQLTIGQDGSVYTLNSENGAYPLSWITDMAVDRQGDVWLVDGGAHYLLEFDPEGHVKTQLGHAWNEGGEQDQFSSPTSVAFDSYGYIYISDTNNHRIQIYNEAREYLATLGSHGSGDFSFIYPEHISIYNNLLYVADEQNQCVKIFNIFNPYSITYVGKLGGSYGSASDQFKNPHGVAVNADYIFVADYGNNRVQVFDAVSLAYIATIGGEGSEDGKFQSPSDVALDASGNLYVADANNQRVQKFTSAFVFSRIFGTTGVPYLTDRYHYFDPYGVATMPDGNIVVVEHFGNRIVKIKPDGTPLWQAGVNGVCGDSNAEFCYPWDVAIASDGTIYVADYSNQRVQIFDSSGAYQNTIQLADPYTWDPFWPGAVAVDNTAGLLYVVDPSGNRVRVFDRATLAYVTEFGALGSSPGEFNHPVDVAVGSTGQVYVVDQNNQRVQVFDASYQFVYQIGVTGEAGRGYDHLRNPVEVAIGPQDRVFIADSREGQIKVYDRNGAFLDCIANDWGTFQGMFRSVSGLAIDVSGNLYITDVDSHQIKRFMPGAYPGWAQSNTAGFGNVDNWAVWGMTVFNDTLYAASLNQFGIGAELYKLANGNWTKVMEGGFGESDNFGINAFESFNGKLYAGTWSDNGWDQYGGQIWRSATPDTGGWEKVVDAGFGNPHNWRIMTLKAFNGYLYAGTWSNDLTYRGAEIWRSDSGDAGSWMWASSGLGPNNRAETILTMTIFDGYLYAGSGYSSVGAEGSGARLWRTNDGVNWEQANENGFGDPGNFRITALAEFRDKLYAGTEFYDSGNNTEHAELWRSSDGASWEKVVIDWGSRASTWGVGGLIVYHDQLYAIANNYHSGVEVWRSPSGDDNSWSQVGGHSFGKEWPSAYHLWDNTQAVYHDRIYIGTSTYVIEYKGGGRIWTYPSNSTTAYLPLIRR